MSDLNDAIEKLLKLDLTSFETELADKANGSQSSSNNNPPVGDPPSPSPEKSVIPAFRFNKGRINLRDELLAYLDSQYWLQKEYPSIADIESRFKNRFSDDKPKTSKEWLAYVTEETFTEALQGRGLPSYDDYSDEVDYRVVVMANFLCDFTDKRSEAAKLKEVGITTKEWNALRNIPKNKHYLNQRINEKFGDELDTDSNLALARLIHDDDLGAIKYYKELTGKYRPKEEALKASQYSMGMIVTFMMEILARHLTTDQFKRVADDLEQSPVFKAIEAQAR